MKVWCGQEAYRAAESRMVQEAMRRHVLRVLRIWRSWFLFSDDYLNGLQVSFGPLLWRTSDPFDIIEFAGMLGGDSIAWACYALCTLLSDSRHLPQTAPQRDQPLSVQFMRSRARLQNDRTAELSSLLSQARHSSPLTISVEEASSVAAATPCQPSPSKQLLACTTFMCCRRRTCHELHDSRDSTQCS